MYRIFRTIETCPYEVVNWAIDTRVEHRIASLTPARKLLELPLDQWQCCTTMSLVNLLSRSHRVAATRYLRGEYLGMQRNEYRPEDVRYFPPAEKVVLPDFNLVLGSVMHPLPSARDGTAKRLCGDHLFPSHVFAWCGLSVAHKVDPRNLDEPGWLLHSYGGKFGPRMVPAKLRELIDHRHFEMVDDSPVELEHYYVHNTWPHEAFVEWWIENYVGL